MLACRSRRYIIWQNTKFVFHRLDEMCQLLISTWIFAFCLCNALFFLLYSVEPNLPLTLVVALRSSLPFTSESSRNIDDQLTSWKFRYLIPLLHILSSLDKELIGKPIVMQLGSFCTSLISLIYLVNNCAEHRAYICWGSIFYHHGIVCVGFVSPHHYRIELSTLMTHSRTK